MAVEAIAETTILDIVTGDITDEPVLTLVADVADEVDSEEAQEVVLSLETEAINDIPYVGPIDENGERILNVPMRDEYGNIVPLEPLN